MRSNLVCSPIIATLTIRTPAGSFPPRSLFADVDPGQSIAWIAARRVTDGAPVRFPLDLCCRRPASHRNFTPPLKLSTGCAAGQTVAAAASRAALELVERDALALWWRGGRRGRPIAEDSAAGRAGAELLAQMRQGKADRQSWVLDITTDLDIPAVVAVSTRPDGFGCALGFAARLSLSAAVRAAIFDSFRWSSANTSWQLSVASRAMTD